MKSICVIAGRECPRTNDQSTRAYCPHWVVGVPENEKDGSGRLVATHTYTGCQLPKLLPYMVGVTAEADHAHAAANEARDSAISVQSTLAPFNVFFSRLLSSYADRALIHDGQNRSDL